MSKASEFSAEEKAAMKERAHELKAEAKTGQKKADGEAEVQAKIAEMSGPDRSLATGVHTLIKRHAPQLVPRTWYGMPAYTKDDKVLCFFQAAGKFNTRYATLGFSDRANLDDGQMWPTAFALKKLGRAEEKALGDLLAKALA